ncbi:hypothetical protein [Paracoccus sp. 22332]|uniref:hypothetical protein n=1 Tax=Paracoccus sp. 22332 TaxID=3453913 RepID=UPI003F859AEF
MATFQQIQADAIRAVDAVMSETLRHFPLAAGKADATRTQSDIRGVLRVGRNKEVSVTGGAAASWSQRIAAGKAELHLDRTGLPDVRKGDKLRATERPGSPWFEVLSMTESAHGRLVLDLGAA